MDIRNVATAVAVTLALALPASEALGAQTLTRRATLAADGEVEVINIAGHVSVTGWDRGEVELTAVIERPEDTLEWTADGRHVRAKLRTPEGRSKGRSPTATFTLRVPQGVLLAVQTVSADIAVADVTGRQRLESVSGEVRTAAFDRDVQVRSVSGDVRVTGRNGKAGAIVSTVSGNQWLTGLNGELDLQAVSGDLEVEAGSVSRLRLKTVSGNAQGRLQLAGGGELDAETISGDLRLTLRPPLDAEFDLDSFSGSLEACFGPRAVRKSKYGPGTELRFTQGSGAARVEVNTLSGDVTICDK